MNTLLYNTNFIGYTPEVSLKEKKSYIINAESEPYTLGDIIDTFNVSGFLSPIITSDGTAILSILYSFYHASSIRIGTDTNKQYKFVASPIIEFYHAKENFGTATQVSFDNLKNCLSLQFTDFGNSNPNLKTINFPVLEYIYSNINNSGQKNTETINIPNTIELTAQVYLGYCDLINITLGTVGILKKAYYPGIFVEECPLSQESVDNILILFASLDGTNGTTLCENGEISFGPLTSPPSASGLAAKAILQSRGWTITNN